MCTVRTGDSVTLCLVKNSDLFFGFVMYSVNDDAESRFRSCMAHITAYTNRRV